mmetsp:Transcript_11251/g.24734  ORF Transcript_11251/g.24734 Transcript_11251/m.24734 type:complete len:97 (-) Transcript_11251:118-408(-)
MKSNNLHLKRLIASLTHSQFYTFCLFQKLQCEDLLKDYGGGPNSKKGSKACSSSKSGKTSKGCKEEPTNKPTNPPTTAPTKSPTFSYNRRNRKVIL